MATVTAPLRQSPAAVDVQQPVLEAITADSVSAPMFGLVWMMSIAGRALRALDAESRTWIEELGSQGARREQAVARLRQLLLRGARYEVNRRRASLGHLGESEYDDLAEQSAADALMAVLSKLDQYRGESRFTTWSYKFALLEAGVKVRRRAWHGREIPLEPEGWSVLAGMQAQPERDAEAKEMISAIQVAIAEDLTARQREVLVALALNGVPIDVLAERLGSSRGALYKTLHDARQKLRTRLAAEGHEIEPVRGGIP